MADRRDDKGPGFQQRWVRAMRAAIHDKHDDWMRKSFARVCLDADAILAQLIPSRELVNNSSEFFGQRARFRDAQFRTWLRSPRIQRMVLASLLSRQPDLRYHVATPHEGEIDSQLDGFLGRNPERVHSEAISHVRELTSALEPSSGRLRQLEEHLSSINEASIDAVCNLDLLHLVAIESVAEKPADRIDRILRQIHFGYFDEIVMDDHYNEWRSIFEQGYAEADDIRASTTAPSRNLDNDIDVLATVCASWSKISPPDRDAQRSIVMIVSSPSMSACLNSPALKQAFGLSSDAGPVIDHLAAPFRSVEYLLIRLVHEALGYRDVHKLKGLGHEHFMLSRYVRTMSRYEGRGDRSDDSVYDPERFFAYYHETEIQRRILEVWWQRKDYSARVEKISGWLASIDRMRTDLLSRSDGKSLFEDAKTRYFRHRENRLASPAPPVVEQESKPEALRHLATWFESSRFVLNEPEAGRSSLHPIEQIRSATSWLQCLLSLSGTPLWSFGRHWLEVSEVASAQTSDDYRRAAGSLLDLVDNEQYIGLEERSALACLLGFANANELATGLLKSYADGLRDTESSQPSFNQNLLEATMYTVGSMATHTRPSWHDQLMSSKRGNDVVPKPTGLRQAIDEYSAHRFVAQIEWLTTGRINCDVSDDFVKEQLPLVVDDLLAVLRLVDQEDDQELPNASTVRCVLLGAAWVGSLFAGDPSRGESVADMWRSEVDRNRTCGHIDPELLPVYRQTVGLRKLVEDARQPDLVDASGKTVKLAIPERKWAKNEAPRLENAREYETEVLARLAQGFMNKQSGFPRHEFFLRVHNACREIIRKLKSMS